jgi:hypothetical protein
MCVNTACCFYPWLYTGCHHQKGGVCKGKSVIKHTITGFDDDKWPPWMNRHCRFLFYKTNATYPFLCSSNTAILRTTYVEKMWSWQNAWKSQKYEIVQMCRFWVDHTGQHMNHGSAHNTDQLVTGQLMIAWVDHRSAHGTVQLATGQLMECLSWPQVGAWHSSVGHGSAHGILELTIGVSAFPTGQRTPTYGRPLVRKLSFLSIFHCLKNCYFWLVSWLL